jgi:NAD(P)-dependent dehydrogenase (short-subunit alcohol dehydrogenase family)
MAQKILSILINTAPELWENENLETLDLKQMEMIFWVNTIAPGPIWTPLTPSTFSLQEVWHFGKDTPMGRAGQPSEVAPCFVFLASSDASCISGHPLYPNEGRIVNS